MAADSGPKVDWQVRPLELAPPRFRPEAFSDDTTLWGLARGRVTRLDLVNGNSRVLAADAWSIQAAPGVVSWRNELGTWIMRDGGEPVRLAGPEPDSATGFDGPPTVLWSPSGDRALLGWQGEWDGRYRLLEVDGSLLPLETRLPGYFGNAAVLWLDSARVLFHTVASAPVGGRPTYRESGWRGDLALLELPSGTYTRITRMSDSSYLRVAGRFMDRVLVAELDTSGVKAHWLYDPADWERRELPLPRGRAFASAAGALVVLLPRPSDSTEAILMAGESTTVLGRTSADVAPVFSPSGRRGVLLTASGSVLFEAAQAAGQSRR